MIDPYEVLGVGRRADRAEIRRAYRQAVRTHHPDVGGTGDAARLAALHEAWDILGDERRRAAYDTAGHGPPTRSTAQPTSPESSRPIATFASEPRWNPLRRYQDPPRFPWRPMLVVAALGSVAVIVASAGGSNPPAPLVDRLLAPGECVAFEPNGDAAEVACVDPHDGVVVELVQDASTCPIGTEAHRDRQGLGIACVRV